MEEISESSLEVLNNEDDVTKEVPDQRQDQGGTNQANEEAEKLLSNLKDELIRKTDVINDLEKQKVSFEKELSHVRKSFQSHSFLVNIV